MEYVIEQNENSGLVINLFSDNKLNLQKNQGEKHDWRFSAIS